MQEVSPNGLNFQQDVESHESTKMLFAEITSISNRNQPSNSNITENFVSVPSIVTSSGQPVCSSRIP